MTNMRAVGTYTGHTSGVYSLAFKSDEAADKHYLVSGSDDCTIKVRVSSSAYCAAVSCVRAARCFVLYWCM